MMLPGVRWECPVCHKVTYTGLGLAETSCQHCGNVIVETSAAPECMGTLLKSRYFLCPWTMSFWERVLSGSDVTPGLLAQRVLALDTARNLGGF
jgi:hypothetical protein